MPTLSYVLSEWVKYNGSRELRPATMLCYEYFANSFLGPRLGGRMVTDLSHKDFEALFEEMDRGGYKPSTIRKCHVTARGALKYARREGWIQRDPTELAKLPRFSPASLTIPTIEEVKTLLDVATKSDRFVHDYAYAIAHTGLRPGEACGLKATDLEDLVLTVRRTIDVSQCKANIREYPPSSERRLKVDQVVANILLARGEWAFGGEQPARTDLAGKRFKRVAKRAGVGHLTPRDLRYFLAVSLLRSNQMPIHLVANLLGYRSADAMLNKFGQYVPSLEVSAPDIVRYTLR